MDFTPELLTVDPTSFDPLLANFNLYQFLDQQQAKLNPDPYLEILIQPKSTGYRFRYASEGDSHGGIPGESVSTSGKKSKTFMTIAIRNFRGKARVALYLVSDKEPYYAHFNELVGKDVQQGVCMVEVSPETNMEASFANVGIQHAKKSEVKDKLGKKILMEDEGEVDPSMVPDLMTLTSVAKIVTFYEGKHGKEKADEFKQRVEERAKMLEPQMAKICFCAFLQDDQGNFTRRLPPVFSNCIQDAKAPSCRELKISHLSVAYGSAEGGTQVTMLCDKFQKKDIEIQFFLENENGDVIWENFGVFTAANVHYQYAIVFQTPPFMNKLIRRAVDVKLRLRRTSSRDKFSDPKIYKYIPSERDEYSIGEKRKKIDNFRPEMAPVLPTFDQSSFLLFAATESGETATNELYDSPFFNQMLSK